ncbi:hypothetical protein E2562_024386 [Oryza meyeriana var. granulata]|uniref:RING-type domain-containing protein n=1 Tax=Oryza meyeriana var. granulata TaxID=110450 RepID=A0A6G1C8Q2_9ORYZ|nr:hypothetical protein E2562_024386 [Oryza meyeriana var. granulata]
MMAGEERLATTTAPLPPYIPLGGDQYFRPVGDDPYLFLEMLMPPEEVTRLLQAEEAAMSLPEFGLTGADAERFAPPGLSLSRASAHPNPFPSFLERAGFHRALASGARRPPPPTRYAVRHVDPTAAAPTAADTSCLGKRKYEEPRGGDAESTECVICIEEFKVGDDLSTMPCAHRHRFHDKCLAKWLARSRSCPLCRHVLPAKRPNNIHFI